MNPETAARITISDGEHAGQTGRLVRRVIEDGYEVTTILLDSGVEVTNRVPAREVAAGKQMDWTGHLPPERGA